MDFNNLHHRLAKGSEFPFLIRFILLTISSWLFQGMLYMDKTEKNFKIILDFLIFLPMFLIVNFFVKNFFMSFLIAIIIAHTFNWVFNGQIFVLLKNLKLLKTSNSSFIVYLDNVKEKIENEDSIIASAVFGSLSREKLKETSDLDVRIIRKPGFVNGFKACFFVLKERTVSFLNRFPLDIYVLDNVNMIHKHIENEKPIIIHDPDNILKNFVEE